ncbi:Sequestosome-1 [Trichostrongylus colubriformis]|uniref:Sequestosome-1 n=1 Tax=Trichostrongylus colubriformis TaxID=6319 RepID=A0AAN8FPB9_TRICO
MSSFRGCIIPRRFHVEMEVVSVKLSSGGVHRRFKIRGRDMGELFSDLSDNLAQISQTEGEFDVAWQDEDGDSIVVTRPVELGEAIEARKDPILRLHKVEKKVEKVESKDSKTQQTNDEKTVPSEDGVHKNILCDVCDAEVTGTRYRCLLCVDYDLCQNCERTGVHAHHGMVRIVDPLRTFVPWGARLKYMPLGRGQRHSHRGERSAPGIVFGDSNTRQRVHLAKEHITEQVARSMQYLQDMGQAVTAALANFGIDASYEVRPDNQKDQSTDEKSKTTPSEVKQPSEAPQKTEHVETSPNETQPTAPPAAPAPPEVNTPKSVDPLPNLDVEEAEEVKETTEVVKQSLHKGARRTYCETGFQNQREKTKAEDSGLVKTPSEKFRHLEKAEEEYRKVANESIEGEDKKEKGLNLPKDALGLRKECRCFVSRVGRWRCPACCKNMSKKAQKSGIKISYPKNQDSDKSSSESSDDSDFETLSHESFQECSDRASPVAKAEESQPPKPKISNTGAPSNEAVSSMYPSLSPAPGISIEESNVSLEDNGIAFRLIEMGFSAEEVFRVVKMHGNNFERCIEEILKK